MDPVTLILTALVAGAAAGGSDVASSAVRDGYDSLRRMLSRASNDTRVDDALAANDAVPGGNSQQLEILLRNQSVELSSDLQDVAEKLIGTIGSDRAKEIIGKIDIRGAQFGNRNSQTNNFG
ncbi:hypothetical protein [Nocardia sp. NPDC003979]